MQAAWRASGSPRGSQLAAVGRCGRCLGVDTLTPTGQVVSENFTGFDSWRGSPRDGLCPACAWGYRTPALRAAAFRVTADPPQLQLLPIEDLAAALARQVGAEEAISVPLRAGRKHVLPEARWGQVCVDGTNLPWSSDDVLILAIVLRLRKGGIPGPALRSPAPPWNTMRSLESAGRSELLEDWERLAPWRDRPAWMDLAVLATNRRTKE